jgi:formamidopyrimidine-DNA glycosylase
MPERPDLEYVVPILARELTGRTIANAEVRNPTVMRVAIEGTAADLLAGTVIGSVTRRAHMVVFDLGSDVLMVVSPMLAGKFQLVEPKARRRKDTALVLTLDDGRQLRYRDDVQMGKVYLVKPERTDVIAGYSPIGVDVLSKAFTLDVFAALAKKRRDQVKLFLMDKRELDAMGNAYADEVLWHARVHPKIRGRELSAEQVARLHAAIIEVLTDARTEVASREAALDVKIRDFLKVRNRKGEPCPRCGTKIRAAGVRGHDAFFCPECQPDSKGRGFVDWRRTRT